MKKHTLVHIGSYLFIGLCAFYFYLFVIITGGVNEMEWHNKCKWVGGGPSYSQKGYDFCDKFGKRYRYFDYDTHKYNPHINKQLT